jgi:hypothetical protein
MDALESNRAHRGQIWQAYEQEGVLTYEMVRTAIKAMRRHLDTDYEEYLRAGVRREDARVYVESDEDWGQGRSHGTDAKSTPK